MNRPHKIIFNDPSQRYAVLAVCEYCGQIAYTSANPSLHEMPKMTESCPCSPEKESETK